MGIAYADIELRNPVRPELATLPVRALADTGAMYLCIPAQVAIQLHLVTHEQREVTLADGSRAAVDYVGPVEVRFGNRRCFVGAMVLGDEVLLGAIPMEDMDLVVRPQSREVTVHPDRPNIAAGIAKAAGWPPRRLTQTACAASP
jgi:clan AA aspartic protease